MRSLVLGALCLALASCASRAESRSPAPERKLTLLFSADLWGQLEPCGCSQDMRGGLDRMAAYVAAERQAGPVLFIDAGDALFDRTRYDEEEAVGARLRAQTVAQALLQMGLSAKAWFERDEVLPEAARFPEELILRGPALREAGGVRVGLVPVEAEGPRAPAPGALRAQVEALRRQGADLVVVLAHGSREKLATLDLGGADWAVGSHLQSLREGEEARAVLRAPTPLFFTQARGQSLLRVEVRLRPGGDKLQIAGSEESRASEIASLDERIRTYRERAARPEEGVDPAPFRAKAEELEARRRALAEAPIEVPATGSYLAWSFLPLTADRPSDPAVAQLIATYDEEVAAANLAWARANAAPCPAPAPGEAAVVGQATCASCHPAAQAFWEQTRHAKAWETLVRARKQHDLDCVSCHVTGWKQPGGPCRVDRVEHRQDVGCESCHGPGSLHAAAPTQVKPKGPVAEATCKSCHQPEHSTGFDFQTYRRQILGPGHGFPAR